MWERIARESPAKYGRRERERERERERGGGGGGGGGFLSTVHLINCKLVSYTTCITLYPFANLSISLGT